MSNGSGITPITPSPKPSASAPQVVQIKTLPEGLMDVARTMRLEGEVVRQNKDGTTQIRTAQGNIDVTIRGRQPQEGQRIEVEIPAGSPPKTATIRPAPQQPQQPSPQAPPTQGQPAPQPNIPLPLPQTPVVKPAQPLPTTPTTQNPSPVTTQPVPQAPVQTAPPASNAPPPQIPGTFPAAPETIAKPQSPLPTTYQPTAQVLVGAKDMPLPALATNQIVRLIPALPAQVQSITQQAMTTSFSPENIVTAQMARTLLKADLIAQKTQGSLLTTLVQSIKQIMPQSVAMPQSVTTPVSGKPQTAMPIIPNLGSVAGAIPNITVNAGSPLLPSITANALTTTNIADATGISKPLQLDARVIDVKPPNVQLVSPTITTSNIKTPDASAIIQGKPAMDASLVAGIKPFNIVATVTGFTPQNLPVVTIQWTPSSPLQNYVLQFASSNLQTGSQIVLLPQNPGAAMTSGTAQLLKPLLPLLQQAMPWPVMDDIYQALIQNGGQEAQALARMTPSPANAGRLGPTAMLFAAAITSGDIQAWIGDKKIEMLQKIGKGSLISRLGSEASSIAQRATDTGNEWRSLPIPMLWQNEISKVMLHVKHDQGNAEQEDKEGSTRFIFDLALTRMGDVQLDGMIRDKRLDIVIRTQVPISYPMQEAMKKAYADALDGTDIYGEIGFQGDLKQWMHVVKREEHLGVSA